MGSNIKSNQIAGAKRTAILKVFSKLKQKVLWKFEDEHLPGKPDNVMIGKWLPQDDILAHPNVKVFISHCGKGSINEARYHGVPILGMPIFGDQPGNLAIIVQEGWGVSLPYFDLNESTFHRALSEILKNPSYRNVVKSAADLYKDRPQHALDTAVYWVEYVIRHNGAKHMQSQAVHLNWFQYNSLDVIGLIMAVLYICWKVFKISFKCLWRKCCVSKKVKGD